MKKNLIIITILFLFTSCANFLEVEPELAISDEQSITNGKGAAAALNGVYNKLASDSYHGVSFRFITNLSGDNLRWVGNSPSNREFDVFEVFTSNSRVESLWNAIYSTINGANHIISKVPDIQDQAFTDAERARILGEAYFIRALNYFDLVRLWGGIPIILKPTGSIEDGLGISRSDKAAVYEQILSDLEKAEQYLALTTIKSRASKGAVWAFRSTLYLYLERWQEAVNNANKVIEQTTLYQLNKSYSDFYLSKNTAESIFEIDYTINNRNNYAINWLPGSLGGRREFLPTDDLISLLNNPLVGGDRKSLLLLDQGIYYGNMDFKPAMGIDQVYVFRLAEIYLNRAEAYVKLKKLADANNDLKKLRARANVSEVSDYANEEELESQIQLERRLEFAFEGKRWFDLIRTNKAKATLGITKDYKLLLPIPQQLIFVDKEIEQNEGYN